MTFLKIISQSPKYFQLQEESAKVVSSVVLAVDVSNLYQFSCIQKFDKSVVYFFFFFFFRHDNVVFHSSRKDGDKSKPILDTIVVIQATIGCPFSFELDAKYSNICQNLLIHSAVFVVIRNTPIYGSPLFIPF